MILKAILRTDLDERPGTAKRFCRRISYSNSSAVFAQTGIKEIGQFGNREATIPSPFVSEACPAPPCRRQEP